MAALLYISLYASLLLFVIGCVKRAHEYSRFPMHLRWELYPVPHEDPVRAAYGGSYFEESEWWTKSRRRNRVGELRTMVVEIILLDTVRKAKPDLWWRSLVFHGGIFGVVFAFLLQVVGLAVPAAVWISRVSLALCIIGSAALLSRRWFDRELKNSTNPAHAIHLVLIIFAASLLLIGSFQAAVPSVRDFVRAALFFNTDLALPATLTVGLFLCCALLAYIPFSAMAHFIGKYFGYHSVRWDDEPNRGEKLVRPIAQNLSYRPTWSAGHMHAGKTWAEIAAGAPEGEVQK
ncbi:MAG TPA: respiratory nitrate reductase subunit gamma [Terriglobales bacterium]|nr:respiratory nitrate reductase subunit gamma [Terriglobales bacterium]